MNQPGTNRALVRYHDRVAAKYDQIYKGAYWDFYRAVTWESWKGLLPEDANAKALDLGCGTGAWGLKLAKSGYAVTFVDISRKMLDVAAAKAERENLLDRAEFVQADLCDLRDLPRNHFAFAVAEGDPISHASNSQQALKQISRLLTEGGRLVGSVDNACAGLDYYFEKGDLEGLEAFIGSGESEWLSRRPEERFPIRMFLPDSFRRACGRAGLAVRSVRGRLVLPVRDHPQLLEDGSTFRRLLKLELHLSQNESYAGRASHLAFVTEKKST